jgi:hypothetical protein
MEHENLPSRELNTYNYEEITRAKLTGQPFPKHLEGMVDSPMWSDSEEEFMKNKVEKQLIGEGYVKQGDIWIKPGDKIVDNNAAKELSAENYEEITRAKLTGQPFPKHLEGMVDSPMWSDSEEAYITKKVKNELEKDGYTQEGEIWTKK